MKIERIKVKHNSIIIVNIKTSIGEWNTCGHRYIKCFDEVYNIIQGNLKLECLIVPTTEETNIQILEKE